MGKRRCPLAIPGSRARVLERAPIFRRPLANGLRFFFFLSVVAAAVFLSCQTSDKESGGGLTPPARSQGCRGLEDRLYRMMNASDPARFAQEQSIYYSRGLVRVAIELSGPDASLPTGYEIQVEARAGSSVQALIQLGELCRISSEPEVRSVMVPFEVKPKGKVTDG